MRSVMYSTLSINSPPIDTFNSKPKSKGKDVCSDAFNYIRSTISIDAYTSSIRASTIRCLSSSQRSPSLQLFETPGSNGNATGHEQDYY